MRIVYLHHANVCRGGIERMFAQKATILADQMGWEVVMLTYEQNGEPFPYPLSSRIKQVNLDVRLYAAIRCLTPYAISRKSCCVGSCPLPYAVSFRLGSPT